MTAELAPETLTIAEVAAFSGPSAHTLHNDERIGLLDPVNRVHGGQRRYNADDLASLAFSQRLRATVMPIRDMRFAELQRELATVTDKITHYQYLETASDE